jgi:hypothetical protein
MASTDDELRRREAWEHLPLQPGEVLVVVGPHGQPDLVHDVLRSHGGRVIEVPATGRA